VDILSVDLTAAKPGFTKRTLYYHFKTKDHVLAAVIQFHHTLAEKRIGGWADRLAAELDAFLDSLFSQLANWAAKPRGAGQSFTRIDIELADLPGYPARAIASRHKTAIEAWLADELAAKGVAPPDQFARQMVLLLEGVTALILIHRDQQYAKAAAAAKALAGTPEAPDEARSNASQTPL
jgi:AcrR family transcriptional regulator